MEDDKAGNAETLPASEVKHRPSIELTPIIRGPVIIDTTAGQPPGQDKSTRPEVIYAADRNGFQMSCLKYGFAVFTSLIWILGLAITGIGIWMLVDPDFWTFQTNLDMKHFKTAAAVAVAVGVFIVLLGFIGTCGACRESSCLLIIYLTVSIIVLILIAATIGIVWSALNHPDFREKIAKQIKKGIENSDKEDASRYFMDLLQSQLQCCGIQNLDEYNGYGIPRSCMNPNTGHVNEKGCVDALLDFLKSKAGILGGVAAGALILQLGAITVTICLLCVIRQGSKAVF